MILFMKNIFRFLLLGIVLLIAAIYYSLNDYKYIDAKESVKLQVSRHQRAINSTVLQRYCKLNQYYDQEEGRCLGVPGGGKILHVENGRSCGINILKSHCTSPLYYYICKRDKSILAQCANKQIFDNRLQRCAYYDSSRLTPSTIQPNDHMYYEHVDVSKSFSIPNCMRIGQFSVPNHCSMFYTCYTNGHRLHQSIFKCPRNMGYQPNKGICAVMSDCENNDSIDSAVCVSDAPSKNVETLNSEEAIEENIEETTEISEESETRRNDFFSKREEINSKIYDDIISTTPESLTDNKLSMDNYGDNDSNLYETSTLPMQSIQDISVSDDIGKMSTFDQVLNPTENVREVQNEKDDSISSLNLQITSPSTIEFDDVPHSIIPPPMTSTLIYNTDINLNVNSEVTDIPFSTVSYMLSKLDEKIHDIITTEQYNDDTVTLSNSNTETLYSPSIISNTPEFSSINDESLKVDKETEDVTEVIDSSTSRINNVPEFVPIIDTSSKLNEEIQDTITEEYRNNDDGILTLPNSNTEAIDPYSTINNVPEFSLINESSSRYEETQSAITEQYGNDDRIMTPPNSNTEIIDQNPTSILNNISVTTSSPNDDFDMFSTATSVILSPQEDINDNQ